MDDRWTEEKILKAIKHYQDSVTRYTKSGNNAKILHAIKRLYDLPITVKHLQETGVGRTINALRKCDGDVGHASRAIVQKWKHMVVQEEDKDSGQEDEPDDDEINEDDDDMKEQDDEQEQKENLYRRESDDEPTHKNKHKSKHNYSSEDSDDDIKNHKSYSEDKHKKHKHDSDKHRNHRHEREKYDKHDKHSKINDSVSVHKSNKNDDNSHKSSHSNSSNDNKHSKHDKEHKHKEREKNDGKRKYEDESTSSSSKKKRYNTDNDDSDEQESEENDKSSRLHKSQNDISTKTPEQEETKPHKSSKHKYKKNKKEREQYRKKDKKKEKNDERDPRINKKLHNGVDENKTINMNKKPNPDKHHKSSSKSSSSKESSSNKSSSKSSHHDDKNKKPDKCDKDKKSSSSVNKIKKDINTDEDGIDCGSGASFAEALGMMEDVPTIRTTFIKKKIKQESNKSPEPSTSKSSNSNKPSTSKSSFDNPNLLLSNIKSEPYEPSTSKSSLDNPNLLSSNIKLEPLDINLSSTLPEITTNYKPLPVTYKYEFDMPMRPINHMTEEEALDYVITSKTQRTKVYSGVKTWRYVPSLFNLCVKVLQDHIDSLEYTGGVPYSILKPVLEKATTTQLFNAENHNPYLIEDTDELWELHCKKLFKGKEPQEMESWRDMYLRCCDEREAKLRSLTKNIKQSQEKSLPVRQTKLAYVDSFVKPPRAIAKKQAKYGTANANNQPLITPSSRLKDVAAPKSSNAVTVPNPAPSSRASSSSNAMMKPKKAPLMQKALAAIKSRFRR